jgi:hypothetical protein
MHCSGTTQEGEEAAVALLNKLSADCVAAGTVEHTDYSSAAQIDDDDVEDAAIASDADSGHSDNSDDIDSDIEYDMLDDVLQPEATAISAAAAVSVSVAADDDTVVPAAAVAEKVVLGERERERTREMTARLRAGLSIKEYCI